VTTLLASAIDSQASSPALLAWFGCLSGIYVFGRGLSLLRPKKPLSTGPVMTIRQAGPGLHEVSGISEGEPTLSAAISGKPCFYYHAAVWRQEEAAQGNAWSKAAEEIECQPFLLNDETGRILVDPRGAKMDLPRDTYEEYGKTLLATHTDIPRGLEDLLVRHKMKANAALRVEEYLISPGTHLFVNGTVTSNLDFDATGAPLPKIKSEDLPEINTAPAAKAEIPAPQAKLETTTPQIIHLSPEPRAIPAAEMTMQSRLAAALTRARMTNPEAASIEKVETLAASAVAVVETIVEESVEKQNVPEKPSLPAAPKQLPPPFLIRGGKAGSPLTISGSIQSGSNQEEVSNTSRGSAFALLAVGPLITLGSAYYLLLHFGWL
jgi:E3 Ubiquitin ligase